MTRTQFITEQTTSKQKVLIVINESTIFIKKLKSHLASFDMHVFISAQVPEDDSQFALCFVVTDTNKVKLHKTHIPTIYIAFQTHKKKIEAVTLPHNSKLITIIGGLEYAIAQIQTILWFAVSKEKQESILTLESAFEPSPKPNKAPLHKRHFTIPIYIIRLFGILLVLVYLFSFWIPLGITSFYSYKSAKRILANTVSEAKNINEAKKPFSSLAFILYQPVRPLYLFFSLAQFPDDLFVVNATETQLTQTLDTLLAESRIFSRLVLAPTRTLSTAQSARRHFDIIQNLLGQSEEQILTIYRKIPPSFLSDSNKSEFQKGILQLRKVY